MNVDFLKRVRGMHLKVPPKDMEAIKNTNDISVARKILAPYILAKFKKDHKLILKEFGVILNMLPEEEQDFDLASTKEEAYEKFKYYRDLYLNNDCRVTYRYIDRFGKTFEKRVYGILAKTNPRAAAEEYCRKNKCTLIKIDVYKFIIPREYD